MKSSVVNPFPRGLSTTAVLDACSLLNLCAAGNLLQPVAAAGARLHVVSIVAREALYLLKGGEGPDSQDRVPIDIDDMVRASTLIRTDPSTPLENSLLVQFAKQVDDGEAAAYAVALARKWTLISDDAKALKLMAQLGHSSLLTTPELLSHWFGVTKADPQSMRETIRRIEQCASYTAPRRHRLRTWWDELRADRVRAGTDRA